jgi:hypothetical protein
MGMLRLILGFLGSEEEKLRNQKIILHGHYPPQQPPDFLSGLASAGLARNFSRQCSLQK